ncbi:UNVERIFIED_CONTAM: hypothetical protein Slati_2130700 [Sesamum latifolium]|uniref:Retrotransposon gag domain-containing protein n=1 Tax=Sesamum latifolium TaxID=2727402 RepID=A0AAW2WRP2_9LAMI
MTAPLILKNICHALRILHFCIHTLTRLSAEFSSPLSLEQHSSGSINCPGAIGRFQEFRSLFLHQFASSRRHQKTELSIFSIRQKEGESLKEYLQRFNSASLEVPSATQEVKASAFTQGLLDEDSFKSLAKKLATKFDALLARQPSTSI